MHKEPKLTWDTKYGELLVYTLIIDKYNPTRFVLIAKIRKGNVDYLAMHQCYIKDEEMVIGKGIWISMEEGCAEEVLLAAQTVLLEEVLDAN